MMKPIAVGGVFDYFFSELQAVSGPFDRPVRVINVWRVIFVGVVAFAFAVTVQRTRGR